MKGIFRNRFNEVRSGWKIILVLIICFALQFIFSLIGGIILSIIMLSSKSLRNGLTAGGNPLEIIQNNPVMSMSIHLLSIIAMIIAVFIILRFMDKKKFKDIGLGFNPKSARELVYGLLLGAISMTLIFLVLLSTGSISLTNGFFSPNFSVYTLTGLITFIFVGIEEELFSRGYCMMVLEQTRKKWVPIIVSSIIFSMLHLLNPNVKVLGLINIFLVGVLFAWMVVKTGSLLMPIGYHITWNYFQGNVFGFPVSGTDPHGIYNITVLKDNILTGGAFGPEAGILTTIVIIIGLLVVSKYSSRKRYTNVFSNGL